MAVGTQPPPEGAEPFDIPGARFSHHQGHCTFVTLLQMHELNDPVLERIARMVDEADVMQEVTVEPAALGLDLICRGMRLICGDDPVALERGALIYDALYAQFLQEQVRTRVV